MGLIKWSMMILLTWSTFTAATVENIRFFYDRQTEWSGICNANNQARQSPIDITTANTETNGNLIELQFNKWDINVSGVFSNTGQNLQFDLNDTDLVRTRNHLGTYILQQFHMHWGNRTGVGSEHRIDGIQQEMEVHFVHTLEGTRDKTLRHYYTVIAVLVQADNSLSTSSPPWSIINASSVQEFPMNRSVSAFVLNQLLPATQDYYYYEGSLTTPPCNETVAWFVMKNTIRMPQVYFEQLRQTELYDTGRSLTYNFREVQQLGNRRVFVSQAPTNTGPLLLFLIISLILVFCA